MSVAFTSDVDKTPATGTSFTYTSFAVTGTNPVILVLIALSSTTATVSGVAVSAGLTAGTPVEVKTQRNTSSGGTTYVSVWAIPAPAGTGTITVTLSDSVPWQSNAVLLSGANQATPCPLSDAVSGITDNAATISLTPTNVTADDASIGAGANTLAGDATTYTPNQTFLNATTAINMTAGYRIGIGSVVAGWADNNGIKAAVAVRVAAASEEPPAAGIPFIMQLGAQRI